MISGLLFLSWAKAKVRNPSMRFSPTSFFCQSAALCFTPCLHGAMPETRETVELPDCDYKVFVEFLRYIYCDELTLSESNVSEVLYMSKKYMMPPLADKCWQFLVSNMYPSNVYSVLSVAEFHEEEKVVNLCWNMIDGQTQALLRQPIERPHLEAIVLRDTLKTEEVKLFTAVDEWARRECEKNGLTPDGKKKRTVLREQIIKETVLSQTGNFTSVPFSLDRGAEYYGFEFLFDRPVYIDENTKYCVEALISGPRSVNGTKCYKHTDWFIFSKSDHDRNGTNEYRGQFSGFIFQGKREG